VGLAKSYKVYAGDKVKIEAWAKYQNPGSTGSNLAGFASALYAAFGVPVPPGGETGTVSSALKIWGGLVTGGSGGINPTGPKAFVNIIVFDKNYKLLDAAWEAVDPTANQIGATPIVPHDYLMREYTAKEEGYVFMFVSNENPTLVDVYFDDIVMTHTKGNVIQYNEYYPFGLQTTNSWTRENNTGNNFLGNGGTELNATSNLYDLHYRNYDPTLGRMTQVDPLADNYGSISTYNFAFNDPVYYNDPLGDSPVKDINDSRTADIQRNQSNSYRPIGDDDMYGSAFGRAGTLGFDYSSPTPESMWSNHLASISNSTIIPLDYVGYDVSIEKSKPKRKYSYQTNKNQKGQGWTRSVSEYTRVLTLRVHQRQQHLTLGGYYTINQVLNHYGYDSRESYLFPKPSLLKRIVNFALVADREDLAQKITEAVTGQWDLINRNIGSVDLDNLERYSSVLFNLKFRLMTNIENLNSKIEGLRKNNPGGFNNSQIISLSNLKWDIGDELIPVNFDINEVIKAITNRKMQ
jgi:RHS repeat-associated protein